MFQQIPFKFEPRESYTFDTYVSGSNELLLDLVSQCASESGEQQVYIWGDEGQGKSHLLQAACNLASQKNRTVCYLPAGQFINQSSQVFDGLESLNLVCIDDVHCLAGEKQWEKALFNLINRCRESQTSLLFSSAVAPEQLKIQLADLQSRLLWGPVLRLQGLSDEEKFDALRHRALQKGLELPENVADYLMRHYPRDLYGLFERLDKLDTASMASQRRLTIPFVKTVLGQMNTVYKNESS